MTPSSTAPEPALRDGREPDTVTGLLSRLDGVEQHSLATQVEVLDAVRQGLDDVLTRPAGDGT